MSTTHRWALLHISWLCSLPLRLTGIDVSPKSIELAKKQVEVFRLSLATYAKVTGVSSCYVKRLVVYPLNQLDSTSTVKCVLERTNQRGLDNGVLRELAWTDISEVLRMTVTRIDTLKLNREAWAADGVRRRWIAITSHECVSV